jgi:fructose-bisphosphate aldolase class I
VNAFLLKERGISSFLKIDAELNPVTNGVRLMKPITHLAALMELANDQHMAGTEMRALIMSNSP